MPDPSPAGVPRRRFLGQVAATLAAGFGFAALGSTGAAAAALRPGGSQSCAIYCYKQTCDGCGPGNHLYWCVDYVCGSDPHHACISGTTCADVCYSHC